MAQEMPCWPIALPALAFVLQDFDLEFSGPGWIRAAAPILKRVIPRGSGVGMSRGLGGAPLTPWGPKRPLPPQPSGRAGGGREVSSWPPHLFGLICVSQWQIQGPSQRDRAVQAQRAPA